MSEWISVEDRLPNDMDRVLCLSVHTVVYATRYISECRNFYPYAHSTSGAPIGKATHWIPLPNPPGAR